MAVKVVKRKPSKKVKKRAVCDGSGVTLEYVPNDVRTLWSGTDYGGGPDGAKGFDCPDCGERVIVERW